MLRKLSLLPVRSFQPAWHPESAVLLSVSSSPVSLALPPVFLILCFLTELFVSVSLTAFWHSESV